MMQCSVLHSGDRVCCCALRALRLLTLALGLVLAPCAAEARQPVTVPRIGVLMFTPSSVAMAALRQGLHELGYEEGQHFTLEVRSAEGRVERLAALAAELVQLPVDLIVAQTTPGVLAAQHATTTLPIVAAVMTDPVQAGSAESLAHPGGNITGSFASRLEVQAKRLELLKEAVPGVTRVAVFLAEGPRGNQEWRTALERTARELGMALHPVEVQGPDDIERALHAIAQGQAEALVVSDASRLGPHAKRIGAFIVEHRLPTVGASRQPSYLMAYGVRSDLLWRRAAVFIDKILKGARPGDLPMERAYQFVLVINLKTAKALGITMPPSLLVFADEVIQ
jgi:putative ABC transport system substrate-binding protein